MTSIKLLRIIFHVAPAGLDDMWGVTEITLLAHGIHIVALGNINHFEVLWVFLSCLGGTGGGSVLLVIVLFSVADDLTSLPFLGPNVCYMQTEHLFTGNRG